MRKSEKWIKGIVLVFYAILSVLLAFVIGVSIANPLNNLFGWQMAIGSVLLAGVFIVFMHFKDRIPKIPMAVYIAFLALFGIVLLVLCLLHGNWYHIAGDYEVVYLSAIDIAEGRDVSFPFYFETYGNNTVPMLLLAGILKIARVLHINEFYLLLVCSIGLVLVAAWAAGEVLSWGAGLLKDTKRSVNLRLYAAVVIAACLPIYVFTSTFYTDTMTFGIGIIVMALFLRAFHSKKGGIVFAILAVALAAWGINWKITSIIPLIAVAILGYVILLIRPRCADVSDRDSEQKENVLEEKLSTSGNEKKKNLRIAIITMVAFLLLYFALSVIVSGFTVYQRSKEKANPLTAWIAMGMMNDGTYAENVEFSDTINALESKEAKSEYAKAQIKEHLGEALSFSHIVKKVRKNYASGTFSANDYTAPDAHGSIMYNLLDPGGAHYWRACQYCFVYIFAVYLVMLYSNICAMIKFFKKKDARLFEVFPITKLLADISFFGLFVFLMLWEANNRQLYNALPVLIVGLFSYFSMPKLSVKEDVEKEVSL